VSDDNNGLGYDVPDSVLVTGRWRVGGQQSNNLYVMDDGGSEYYVGALFRPHYGPAVVGRLNLVRMAVRDVAEYPMCVVNTPKQCVRPLSHGGWHISNSGTTWPS
jgi:hypothetical protein